MQQAIDLLRDVRYIANNHSDDLVSVPIDKVIELAIALYGEGADEIIPFAAIKSSIEERERVKKSYDDSWNEWKKSAVCRRG